MDEKLMNLTSSRSSGQNYEQDQNINIDWNLICVKLNLELENEFFLNKKQIRDHWNNKMNPGISQEKFSVEEDQIIMDFIN